MSQTPLLKIKDLSGQKISQIGEEGVELVGGFEEPGKVDFSLLGPHGLDNLAGHLFRRNQKGLNTLLVAPIWVCQVKKACGNWAWIDSRDRHIVGRQLKANGIGKAQGRKLSGRIDGGLG